jgi:hypothetical protein
MRESRTYGSVRGALSNERPYRDRIAPCPPYPSQGDYRRIGGHAFAFAHPTNSYPIWAYFTAEKRFSNEFACMIGAEPATCASLVGGAAD